jgi:hypothetical protein
MTLIGLEVVAILLLFLSFWEAQKGNYRRIVGMNIIMVFVMFILYYSHQTFTYIHPGDVEKIMTISVSFILSELFGIFWGRQFFKHQHNKKTN